MSVQSTNSCVGRWFCLRHEDGTLFEEYAYLVTDVANVGYHSRVYYVRRWPGRNDTATVVESKANFREWRAIASSREVMPDGWLPNWWGVLPEGPSMTKARNEGRVAL
jgi:hypothetical protein